MSISCQYQKPEHDQDGRDYYAEDHPPIAYARAFHIDQILRWSKANPGWPRPRV